VNPFTFIRIGLEPGFSLLPPRMDKPRARALVMAIGLQESELRARRQMPTGPARGYFQFEPIAVREVLTNGATADHAMSVCEQLDIPADAATVHAAIQWNDPLAVAFARLLLWRDPAPLPDQHQDAAGWSYYIRNWGPGKPHPKTWAGAYGVAHDLVGERKP
jgi:hypothetical protein